MTAIRRAVLIAAVALALSSPASAEVGIDRAHRRADAHCAHVAAALSRHGLSARETAHLAKMDCRLEGSRWISSLVWGA